MISVVVVVAVVAVVECCSRLLLAVKIFIARENCVVFLLHFQLGVDGVDDPRGSFAYCDPLNTCLDRPLMGK